MASTLMLVADAIDLATSLANSLATTLPIIRKAQAEGRTILTAEEWTTITSQADTADAQLEHDLHPPTPGA